MIKLAGVAPDYAARLDFSKQRSPAALQFIRHENNIPVASNFIQYLSLLDGKGRNAELAELF